MERRLCDTTRASFAVNLIIIIFSTCESAIDFIQWYCGYSSSDRKRSCYENTHRTERWRMKNIPPGNLVYWGIVGKFISLCWTSMRGMPAGVNRVLSIIQKKSKVDRMVDFSDSFQYTCIKYWYYSWYYTSGPI